MSAEPTRAVSEELAFRTASLDAAMLDAGFHLAFSDPEAARDFGYRARYIRSKTTLHPLLSASLEYYHAAKAFSLKISTSDEQQNRTYGCLVKNFPGDLKELLERYFTAVRKGLPLVLDDKMKG